MTGSTGASGLVHPQARARAKRYFLHTRRNQMIALHRLQSFYIPELQSLQHRVGYLTWCSDLPPASVSPFLRRSKRYPSLHAPENQHQYNTGWSKMISMIFQIIVPGNCWLSHCQWKTKTMFTLIWFQFLNQPPTLVALDTPDFSFFGLQLQQRWINLRGDLDRVNPTSFQAVGGMQSLTLRWRVTVR